MGVPLAEPTAATATPAKAWNEMRRGNERFVGGEPSHPRQDVERRAELAGAQTPRAALFGCSDSRLAAEIIFDMGLGDLFVIRNAGQVVSSSVLGSLEYAVAVLNVPLIVVLGHDECGAVRAAIDSQSGDAPLLPPHIDRIIQKIVPAVQRVGVATGAVSSDDGAQTQVIDTKALDASLVGREHLRDTIAELLERSEMISDAVAAGTLAIVGANYRLLEGRADADIVVGSI
jgi:carbonic anhydrase